jgi:hypothetical protein
MVAMKSWLVRGAKSGTPVVFVVQAIDCAGAERAGSTGRHSLVRVRDVVLIDKAVCQKSGTL